MFGVKPIPVDPVTTSVTTIYIYIYVVTSGSKDKIRLDLKALATRMKAIL